MKLEIVSSRRIYQKVFWQIVYEWENDFAAAGGIPISKINTFYKSIPRKIYYHDLFYPYLPKSRSKVKKLIYFMTAPYGFNFYSSPDYVPIIIDAWKPDLERIINYCKYNEIVFVGSLEATIELRNRGFNKVHYLPVSIPKKYKQDVSPEKDIDLISYGRQHLYMYNWINELFNYKNFHIVKIEVNANGNYNATSNLSGFLGNIISRSDLMSLIKRSRYSLVSSTGNDLTNTINYNYTGGFSPITPRFLECAVNYTTGIGVWPSNPDFSEFNFESIGMQVKSLDELIDKIKVKDTYRSKDKFDDFLSHHWSEKRLDKINKVLIENIKIAN